MPQVGKRRFPYTRRGQAQAQAASRGKQFVPPRTPSGVAATPKPGAPPPGAPVPKDVRQMPNRGSAAAVGAPKSTMPRHGTLGYKGAGGKVRKFDPELVERLRERLGKKAKGQGAYNLLHRRGEASDALSRMREKVNKKRKFGGPKDGRKSATSAS